jgi:hypothetical protein
VLKRLGLPGHLHTFRHSFISDALINNVPEAVLRSWVGQCAETMKIYTHIANQESRAAMNRFAEANQGRLEQLIRPESVEKSSAQFQHSTEDEQNDASAK